jgi:hypothetical protein
MTIHDAADYQGLAATQSGEQARFSGAYRRLLLARMAYDPP